MPASKNGHYKDKKKTASSTSSGYGTASGLSVKNGKSVNDRLTKVVTKHVSLDNGQKGVVNTDGDKFAHESSTQSVNDSAKPGTSWVKVGSGPKRVVDSAFAGNATGSSETVDGNTTNPAPQNSNLPASQVPKVESVQLPTKPAPVITPEFKFPGPLPTRDKPFPGPLPTAPRRTSLPVQNDKAPSRMTDKDHPPSANQSVSSSSSNSGISPRSSQHAPSATADKNCSAEPNEGTIASSSTARPALGDDAGTAAAIRPDLYIKHPLKCEWRLWYFYSEKNKNWNDCQHRITDVSFVEDFWSLFNHINGPSKITSGDDLSFFKNGIRPMWEDPQNRKGGRVCVLNVSRGRGALADDVWLDILLFLIGEQYQHTDDVCGVVASSRSYGYKIAIWTRDCIHSTISSIISDVKDYLMESKTELPPNYQIQFEIHNQKNASFSKPKKH